MSWIRRETEKETVQYICPHCHDYHEFREDFGERTFSENYIFCRRCGARNGTGNAPTLTPPNEPLMPDELKEMGGKPVWTVGVSYTDDGKWAMWDIVEKADDEGVDFGYSTESREWWNYNLRDKDGKLLNCAWVCYSRSPEGEEDIK